MGAPIMAFKDARMNMPENPEDDVPVNTLDTIELNEPTEIEATTPSRFTVPPAEI